MGYSKKLYNVLGGYAYYNTMGTLFCLSQGFTNILKTIIYFCAFFTIVLCIKPTNTLPDMPLSSAHSK